jgi:hypothetical protein
MTEEAKVFSLADAMEVLRLRHTPPEKDPNKKYPYQLVHFDDLRPGRTSPFIVDGLLGATVWSWCMGHRSPARASGPSTSQCTSHSAGPIAAGASSKGRSSTAPSRGPKASTLARKHSGAPMT